MTKQCLGADCGNDASTLQCPTCQKQGVDSFFCSQECFKRNWTTHKSIHKSTNTGTYNPFPKYDFTGPLRPVYPLSPRRAIPDRIPKPDYAIDGNPRSEFALRGRNTAKILTKAEQEGVRKVCRLAREVLDIAASALAPGVTTDRIDEIVHEECIKRDSYPSPLNYMRFPKSVCTSLNEAICHGIPDQRPLKAGDIVNIDVTLYHGGFHGDLNETYYVAPETSAPTAESILVVETARECLDQAIAAVKPGMLFREPGNIIEKHAKAKKCGVVRTYCGHGVNQLFHTAPNVPHYAKSKAVGQAKPGMCFTIEPMINAGSYRDRTWDDNWTSVTVDGRRSAQFEHTLLVTEEGVEVLTARGAGSPGGPWRGPVEDSGVEDGEERVNGETREGSKAVGEDKENASGSISGPKVDGEAAQSDRVNGEVKTDGVTAS